MPSAAKTVSSFWPNVFCRSLSNCSSSDLLGCDFPTACANRISTTDSSKLSVAILASLETEPDTEADFRIVRLAAELPIRIHAVIPTQEVGRRDLSERAC